MKLSIDLDSTLCTFCEGWVEWCYEKNLTPFKLTLEDIKSYDYMGKTYGEKCNDFFLKNPYDCYENWLKPYPNSGDFLEWCSNRFDTEIITHACKKETEEAKIEFCRKHYNFKNVKFVKNLHDKYIHLQDRILIDDYPVHCVMNNSRNGNDSIIFNINGKNGWSNISTYNHLIEGETINPNKLWYSTNYNATKRILRRIKYGE